MVAVVCREDIYRTGRSTMTLMSLELTANHSSYHSVAFYRMVPRRQFEFVSCLDRHRQSM